MIKILRTKIMKKNYLIDVNIAWFFYYIKCSDNYTFDIPKGEKNG